MEDKSKDEIEENVSPNHSSIKDEQNSEQNLFEKMLGKLQQSSENPSTYRVPKDFRADKSYYPTIVSIGPSHSRNRPSVRTMEDQKWSYMQYFLRRPSSEEYLLESCSEAILKLDSRQSYAEKMLLDGCFILEIFLRYKSRDLFGYTNDRMLDNAWMISNLQHDLALLENQIPFIVLETLSDIILARIPEFQGQPSISIITDLALFFFHSDDDSFFKFHIEKKRSKSYKHLLHLLHDFQVQSLSASLTRERNRELLPVCYKNNEQKEERMDEPDICATRLLEDGIDLERGSTEAYHDQLLAITFSKGVIKIPTLCIKQTTDSLLRNLIAFEQSSTDSTHHHITSYVILLNKLIHSSRDIKLLKEKRIIIIRWGNAEDVLTLFNRFSKEVASKDKCFVNLIDEIHEFRKSYWHWHRQKLIWKLRRQKYLTMLHKDYFSSPWSIISFIAAVVLIVLTGLQTYFTIYSKK